MQQWEYKMEPAGDGIAMLVGENPTMQERIRRQMVQAGMDGWELCGQYENTHKFLHYIFKRPVSAAPDMGDVSRRGVP